VAAAEVPRIGGRLRAERLRRGVTVRGLARDVGVSASLISQIETDRKSPSVSTLYAITTALGISVEDLFAPNGTGHGNGDGGHGDGGHGHGGHGDGGGRADGPAVRPAGAPVGPVTGPGQRRVLTLDSGVTWELLGQVPHAHRKALPGAESDERQRLEFLLITYPPGASSSTSGLLMRHSGTECGYVLRGELILTLGFDEYRLTAGDSVSFDSTTPHGYRNEGTEPAVGVWFVLERAG
jgi:quercetin dioxygenase-like cupin family protein/DNA-binding XRE family transcriptional regulator